MDSTSNSWKLGQLKPGSKGKVTRINAQGSLRRRILDMGLIPGENVEVKGQAPFGDPIEITVKGYQLSLRKEEANSIMVEVI